MHLLNRFFKVIISIINIILLNILRALYNHILYSFYLIVEIILLDLFNTLICIWAWRTKAWLTLLFLSRFFLTFFIWIQFHFLTCLYTIVITLFITIIWISTDRRNILLNHIMILSKIFIIVRTVFIFLICTCKQWWSVLLDFILTFILFSRYMFTLFWLF